MLKPIRNILGVGSIPSHRASAVDWMRRNGVYVHRVHGSGGIRFEVNLLDLPFDERILCIESEVGGASVVEGQYDDLMHAEFALATPARRDRAERKAAIALTLITLREQGVKEADRLAIVRKKFGSEGTSTPSFKRLLKAVKGVAPINFAPALLDKYTPPKKRAEMSEDAWRFFMTLIRDAAPEWPLKSAWRDTRDAGSVIGWDVPSYSTIYRRWADLDEAQRVEARLGYEAARARQCRLWPVAARLW